MTVRGLLPEGTDERSPVGAGDAVVLEGGDARTTPVLAGAPTATPAPTVEEHVQIRVRRTDGSPAPAVVVEAASEGRRERAVADEAGGARLTLPAGTWSVRVRDARLQGAPIFLNVPEEREGTLLVTTGVRLEVAVVDPEGKPVEGVAVEETEEGEGFPVLTGPDGVADLGAVHPAWAFLVLTKPGWLGRREWANNLHREGERHRMVLRMMRGASLDLSFVEADGSTPVAGVRVWADHDRGGRRDATSLGPSGAMRLEGVLAPGVLTLHATASDGRRVTERLTVEDPPKDAALRVRFPEPGRLTGVVRAEGTDAPIADARIYVPDPWGTYEERARSDRDGRFVVFPVPREEPGHGADLLVVAPGWAQAEEARGDVPVVDGGGGVEGAEDSLDVRLVATRAVVGRVLRRDGTPLGGATVELSHHDRFLRFLLEPRSVRTRADGTFRLEEVPPWERLHAVVEAGEEGLGWAELFDEEAEVHRLEVEIRLEGAFRAAFPVVDEGGVPVAQAWAWFRWHHPTDHSRVAHRQIERGAFLPVAHVPAAGGVVEITGPGYLTDHVRFDATTREIVLQRALRAVGVLVDGAGRPMAGVEVRLESAEKLYTLEGNAGVAKTDAEGRFAVEGIRAGRYAFRVSGTKLKTEVHLARDGQDWGRVVVR